MGEPAPRPGTAGPLTTGAGFGPPRAADPGIGSERLVLRRFVPEDWRDLHAYLSQPETVRFEPYGPFTVEESKVEAAARSQNPEFWAVCLRASGRLVGNLYMARREFDSWEIGYVFDSRHWGRGLATEAASTLVEVAFTEWGAHRVTAMCNPENTRSWRLLERLGLRREGHLRRDVWFARDADGEPIWQDTYLYGLLASEWRDVPGRRGEE